MQVSLKSARKGEKRLSVLACLSPVWLRSLHVHVNKTNLESRQTKLIMITDQNFIKFKNT